MSTNVANRRVANSRPLFLELRETPDDKRRLRSFVASYVVQIAALIVLLIYSILAPQISLAPIRHVDLVAPNLENAPPEVAQAKPVRQPVRVVLPRIVDNTPPKIQPPSLVEPRQPQRVHHVVPVEEIKQPQLTVAPKLDPKLLNQPKVPAKIVAINTFSATSAAPFKPPTKTVATDSFGSSATPTLGKMAPSKVQTGGFGDPNGVPVNAHANGKTTIAAVGSFDLPPGAGHGNGTGGASGARGTVASAGFGNGVAVQGRPGNSGQTHTGGFGSGIATQGHSGNTGHVETTAFKAPEAAPAQRTKAVSEPDSIPVSIQSKPTPIYTAEARQARVEGEVLLSVVFMANGQIRILNVVRGLGHGLDESAQRAAQGVKFVPAMHNGHPVDSTATLRIVFQLL